MPQNTPPLTDNEDEAAIELAQQKNLPPQFESYASDLGKGDISGDITETFGGLQKQLTSEEQEEAATRQEQKRLEAIGPAPEERLVGGGATANLTKQATALKKQLDDQISDLNKQLGQKKQDVKGLESKLAIKIVRIIIEGLSLIGIAAAIYEIITMMSLTSKLRTAKNDVKKINNNKKEVQSNYQQQINQLSLV